MAPATQVRLVHPILAKAAKGSVLTVLYPWAVIIFICRHEQRFASQHRRRSQMLGNLRFCVPPRWKDGLVVFSQQAKLVIVLQSFSNHLPQGVMRLGTPLRAQLGLHDSELARRTDTGLVTISTIELEVNQASILQKCTRRVRVR